jgi:hypothetical protein
MDEKEELAKAKWLLFAGAFFLVSCFLVYDEFAYLVWGREVEATVEKAYETTRRGRFGVGGRTRLDVDFAFTEPDGTRRKGTSTVECEWPLPASGKVMVEYTPGQLGRSRLKGRVHWTGIIIFFVSIAAVAAAGYKLWQEANEQYKPRERKRGAQ